MQNIEVVAAVIIDNDKIFATQRGYGEFKGRWEFPGGKVECGESLEIALLREIKEELGVSIIIQKKLCTVEYDYPNFHIILHCFICQIESGTPYLLEHESAKWLSKENINSVNWLDADVSVIKYIKETVFN